MIKKEELQKSFTIDQELILNSTNNLIVAFTKDYEIQYCNNAFKKTFKMFTQEKLEENQLLNSYESLSKFSELADSWNNWIERAFAGEHVKDILEYKIIDKKIFYRLDIRPVYNEDKVEYVQLVAKEDTLKHNYEVLLKKNKELSKSTAQKEEIEQKIVATNEKISAIYQRLSEVVWDYDIKDDKIILSPNYSKVLDIENKDAGIKLAEWQDLIIEKDLKRVQAQLDDCLNGSASEYKAEYQIKTLNSKKWIFDSGKIVARDEENKPTKIVGILKDITSKKKIESLLNNLRKQISKSALLVFWHDDKGNIKFANKLFLEKLGYTEKEILDINIKQIEHLEYDNKTFISNTENKSRETIYYSKNNEKFFVETVTSQFVIDDEQLSVVYVTDLTERKNIENKLKESESKFHSVAENLPIMVWLTNEKIDLVYANKKSYEFVGNYNLAEIVHPDDYEFFKYNMISSVRKNKQISCEVRIKKLNSEYRWVLADVVPRFSDEGKFKGLLGIALDITERKEIEHKYLESENILNEITSVVGDGIFLIDEKLQLQFANPEFEKLLGYKFNELENKSIFPILNRKNEECPDCPFKVIFQKGEEIRVSVDYFIKKDGTNIPVSYVISPINRNGVITGAVIAFHDISEQLEAEEELNRYIEELQISKQMVEENASELTELNQKLSDSESKLKELNANKDKFFSIISHDLRSPFSSIIGFAEVMLEDLDTLSNEDIKDFVTNIYKSSKNLQNLLENLLKWSRVQTGRIEFNQITFDLNNLVNDIVTLFQINAARKKITLENGMETNINIRGDKFMLDTIIRNLISNAIKFTKANGTISVFVEDKKDHLLFTIEDDGVGMTEEIKNKLFKIEEHVTTRGTEKEKGTGIGLILCKEFVDIHKGKIWVESTPDIGSKFKFTIPQ